MSTEYDILDWLAGSRGHSASRRRERSTKIYRDKPDTSSNGPGNDDAYVPMEQISKAFIRNNLADEKVRQDKAIREQIATNKGDPPKVKPVPETDYPMDDVSRDWYRRKEVNDQKIRDQQIDDAQLGRTRDSEGNITKKKPGKVANQSEATTGQTTSQDDSETDNPMAKIASEVIAAQDTKRKKDIKDQLEATSEQEADPKYKPPVEKTGTDQGTAFGDPLALPPVPPVTDEMFKSQPVPASGITAAATEIPNATKEQTGVGVLDAPAAQVPIFARPTENVEAVTGQDSPLAPKPAFSGPLPEEKKEAPKEVPFSNPMGDVFTGTVTETQDQPIDPVNKALSDDFKRATSRPEGVLGIYADPASPTYDAVRNFNNGVRSLNYGFTSLPFLARQAGSYLYYPIDKLAGTKLQEKHQATTDQMQQFLNDYKITKNPETFMERSFAAAGMMAMPLPAAEALAVKAADSVFAGVGKQVAGALIPGVSIKAGSAIAPQVGAAALTGAAAFEGIHQILEGVKEAQKTNPPVPNSQGDVEPRVQSMPPDEAKTLQKMVTGASEAFTKNFAEANYGTSAVMAAGGLAALYGIYKGMGALARSPLPARTVIPGAAGKGPPSLTSAITPGEATRTMFQDAQHVLKSQAQRAGDDVLAKDIGLQTRGALDSRMEAMRETGNIIVPGYSTQLKASPIAIAEAHLARPEHVQQELSQALHVMNQVDQATIGSAQRQARQAAKAAGTKLPAVNAPYTVMPSQQAISDAKAVLAKPEHAGIVQAMQELRTAQAEIGEKSGYWSQQAKQELLRDRPNYVHSIPVDEFVKENGVTRVMTKAEQWQRALNTKTDELLNHGHGMPDDLGPLMTRRAIDNQPVMFDAVLSTLLGFEKVQRFAFSNDIVSRYIRTLEGDAELAPSILKQKGNRAVPENAQPVKFWENGKEFTYHVDPMVANALKFNAPSAMRWLTIPKNFMQWWTTGPGAPWFVFNNASLDAHLGHMTKLRGTRLGWMDQAVQTAAGRDLPAPGKVVGTYAATAVAAFNAHRADQILASAQALERAILSNPHSATMDLMQAFGQGYVSKQALAFATGHNITVQGALQDARRMYQETAKGIAMREGMLHSSRNEMLRNIAELDSENTKRMFQRYMGAQGTQFHNFISTFVNKAADLKNGYLSGVSNLHDAPRLSYVEANKGLIDMRTLAHETRNLTGDLNKQGMGRQTGYTLKTPATKGDLAANAAVRVASSKAIGGAIDVVRLGTPYFNPHIQGMTRLAEAIKRDPTQVISGLMSTIMMPQIAALGLAAHLGPEYLDHMLNKREEWKKTNYHYWPIPGLSPDKGLEFRIDPLQAPFSYPIIEALDAAFGLREMVAKSQNREMVDAERQGMFDAFKDGVKEYVGLGLPWPVQLGAAMSGTVFRNVTDPSYTLRGEKLTGTNENVKNASSMLSIPVQLIFEQILGEGMRIAIHSLDAYNSSQSVLEGVQAAGKQTGVDVLSKVPVVGNTFFGNKYNQPGTTLSKNNRELLQAVDKIDKVSTILEKGLARTAKDRPNEAQMEMPNLRMGAIGNPNLPEGFDQAAQQAAEMLKRSGVIKTAGSERAEISDSLNGLRGVNAGNIGRFVKVPYPKGIAGLNYIILHEERLKDQATREKYNIENPEMTPGSAPGAKRFVAPKVAKNQPPRPLSKVIGEDKVVDQRMPKFERPTFKDVNTLMTALNKRRDVLDLRTAAQVEAIQKTTGLDFKKIAKQIKNDPSDKDDLEE